MSPEKAQQEVTSLFEKIKRYLILGGDEILVSFRNLNRKSSTLVDKVVLGKAVAKFTYLRANIEEAAVKNAVEAVLHLFDP